MNTNYRYLGIVATFSEKNKFIDLKDSPPNLPNIDFEFNALIGFTEQFAKAYKITKMEKRKSSVRLFFDKNTSVNLSQFVRMAVFVDKHIFDKINFDGILPQELLGTKVLDQTNTIVGEIVDVNVLPSQFLLYVENNELIIPIPFLKDNLVCWDKDNKILKLELVENYREIGIKKEIKNEN